MDVDAVLQSVQERDKWRRRVELLSTSLKEVRERRRRVVARLRRIETEIRRLGDYSEAVLDHGRPPGGTGKTHGARIPALPAR